MVVFLAFLERLLVRKMAQICISQTKFFFRLELLQPVPRNSTFSYKERKINADTHEREKEHQKLILYILGYLPSFLVSIFPTNHMSKDLDI